MLQIIQDQQQPLLSQIVEKLELRVSGARAFSCLVDVGNWNKILIQFIDAPFSLVLKSGWELIHKTKRGGFYA